MLRFRVPGLEFGFRVSGSWFVILGGSWDSVTRVIIKVTKLIVNYL